MQNYYDIHTHYFPQEVGSDNCVHSIYNRRAGVNNDICTFPFSYGIHPYDVDKISYSDTIFDSVTDNTNLIAIGEIGLDFRFQETINKQIEYFKAQINIAAKYNYPIILHIVKALPQTLRIIESSGYKMPFIVHGFRNGKKQADEIINKGGFISISPMYPTKLKELYPHIKNRLLLETDETGVGIIDHYRKTASILGIDTIELQNIIEENIKNSGIKI